MNATVLNGEWIDVMLSDREKMLFDFLFSEQSIFYIDLNKHTVLEYRPKYRDEIRTIIKRGGLEIIDDRIIHTDDTVIWKIEIKK